MQKDNKKIDKSLIQLFQSQNDQPDKLKQQIKKSNRQQRNTESQINELREQKIRKRVKINQQLILSTGIKNQYQVEQKQNIFDKSHSNLLSDPFYLSSQESNSQEKKKFIEKKWDDTFKSLKIQVKDNIIRLLRQNVYQEHLCFINTFFTKYTKQKQSWVIKINKNNKGRIRVGICLKNKMVKNFKMFRNGWKKIKHGLFLLSSNGDCFSHSQKQFNHVNKNFKFGSNDVIHVEYDPIDKKLRFIKNKVEYFEMPVPSPSQNDSYHPFVALSRQNDSVQLIKMSDYILKSKE